MTIDPLKAKPTTTPDTSEASRAARPAPARHSQATAAPARSRTDSVELSAEARESSASHGPTSSSGLSASRLKEVVDRVNSGYYDTDRVRDTVARRIQQDQGTPQTE